MEKQGLRDEAVFDESGSGGTPTPARMENERKRRLRRFAD
jgi:hypothetical protein